MTHPHKRALVADDEENICAVLQRLMRSMGWQVDVAHDGLKARDLLLAQTYDIVYFDCNMPELSGKDLIQHIKQSNPKAKTVMISGDDQLDTKTANKLGIDLFLQKPFSLDMIRTQLVGL